MNQHSVEPCEAVNLEPLSRFRFRRVTADVDNETNRWAWKIWAGHRSINEYYGEGETLTQAIFNAGIDVIKPTFTD